MLYTHSITMNPEIHIVSVEVREPGNYSVPPKFKRDLDSISKLIEYPSIAKRAEVEGMVKLLLTIDSTGNVIKAFVD